MSCTKRIVGKQARFISFHTLPQYKKRLICELKYKSKLLERRDGEGREKELQKGNLSMLMIALDISRDIYRVFVRCNKVQVVLDLCPIA